MYRSIFPYQTRANLKIEKKKFTLNAKSPVLKHEKSTYSNFLRGNEQLFFKKNANKPRLNANDFQKLTFLKAFKYEKWKKCKFSKKDVIIT
jgi:hypothetical protein